MTGKGIIFSAPMVRALLAGTKTQTRRLATFIKPDGYFWNLKDAGGGMVGCDDVEVALHGADYAPYAPGDRLYVREAWTVRMEATDVVEVGYRAHQNASYTEYVEQWPVASATKGNGQWPRYPKYGPSIHMPRWASRLWLTVTDVRVQLLQDISEADAVAEGIDDRATAHFGCPIKAYAALWDSLHGGESDHAWLANPWIVAVSFAAHHGNIDGAVG